MTVRIPRSIPSTPASARISSALDLFIPCRRVSVLEGGLLRGTDTPVRVLGFLFSETVNCKQLPVNSTEAA